MAIVSVSTALIHPALAYDLTIGAVSWRFAHPVWWAGKADISMDRNAGELCKLAETAMQDFWEFVAPVVVWPAASVVAGEIIERSKAAALGRAEIASGYIGLF